VTGTTGAARSTAGTFDLGSFFKWFFTSNKDLPVTQQRSSSSATSAFHDTVGGVWNAGIGTAELATNFFGGFAVPGGKDYWPWGDRLRISYDTPAFGSIIEVITVVGGPAKVLRAYRIAAEASTLKAAEGAASPTTTLFRAASHAEFADAMEWGILRPGPNSYATGKFFAESGKDAAKWGNVLEGAGNFRILQLEFPSSTADKLMRFERLDGIGPARFGTFDQIGQPTIKLWTGSP
jgi:hypothetical protein